MCAFAAIAAATLAGQFQSQTLLGVFYGGLAAALGIYAVWGYWRGLSWARVVVLIVSFGVVAEGISSTLEQGGSFVTLMSHPVRFLRFAMAAFLLYWLNTHALRAWFRNAGAAADLIGDHLTGKLCTAVEKHGSGESEYWMLAFEHDAELILNCSWRIVLDDNLAFASNTATEYTSSGEGQAEVTFDEETPQRLLQNLRVHGVRVAPRTSDLFITFEMGIELQTWSVGRQEQQWRFSDPVLTIVANPQGMSSHNIAAGISNKDSAVND
jgi:hypothetical protein